MIGDASENAARAAIKQNILDNMLALIDARYNLHSNVLQTGYKNIRQSPVPQTQIKTLVSGKGLSWEFCAPETGLEQVKNYGVHFRTYEVDSKDFYPSGRCAGLHRLLLHALLFPLFLARC